MSNKFKKVFYILQTKPRLKVCGYTFNRDEARYVSERVRDFTGNRGKIVEFTREELVGLGYVRPS